MFAKDFSRRGKTVLIERRARTVGLETIYFTVPIMLSKHASGSDLKEIHRCFTSD